MFELIHKVALVLHITIGSIALFIFWLPIIEKKGSPLHRQVGQWFVWGMTTVAISGIIMSSFVFMDPLAIRDPLGTLTFEEANRVVTIGRSSSAFLFMLSFLVLCTTRQSVLALKAKMDKSKLKSPIHLFSISMLFLSGLYVGLLGFERSSVLYYVFSVLSMFSALTMFRYIFKKETKKSEWIIEHLTNIVGSGIAAYTAFFVFGGQTFMNEFVPRDMQILFWIMPGVVGGILAQVYAVKYRKLYKVA